MLVIRSDGPNFCMGGNVPEWPGKSADWFRTFCGLHAGLRVAGPVSLGNRAERLRQPAGFRKSSSHVTRRWREVDSNCRSHLRARVSLRRTGRKARAGLNPHSRHTSTPLCVNRRPTLTPDKAWPTGFLAGRMRSHTYPLHGAARNFPERCPRRGWRRPQGSHGVRSRICQPALRTAGSG